MKNLYYFSFIAFVVITILSCNNEEVFISFEDGEEVTSINREKLVNAISRIHIDLVLANEIHQYVTSAMSEGQDEEVLVADMLSTEQSTHNLTSTYFGKRLQQLAQLTSTRSLEDVNTFCIQDIEALLGSRTIIYWPYSEDWDGIEMPTLVAAPEDEDATEAYGLRPLKEGNSMLYEKVLVNEDYMQKHPVWVITDKEPDDGVIYLKSIESDKLITRATRQTGYLWNLDSMQVTHQYDGVFSGASDIDIQIAYPVLPGYSGTVNKFRVSFPRKTIRKKKWKYINMPLNTDWTSNQITNGILVTESDPGDNVNVTMSYAYQDGNNTFSGNVVTTIGEDDEMIGQTSLARSYILSFGRYSFDSNHVNMVMPISTYTY